MRIQLVDYAAGQGQGRAIISDLIARASEERKLLRLRVGLKNEKARRLYERLGFKCVAQTETHYQMVWEPGSD